MPVPLFQPFNRCAHQLLRPVPNVPAVQPLRSVQTLNSEMQPGRNWRYSTGFAGALTREGVVACARGRRRAVIVIRGLARGSFLYQESDLALSGLRRRHELPNGVKHDLKLGVILLFEHFEFFREIFVTRQDLP